jgi:urease accessory protein
VTLNISGGVVGGDRLATDVSLSPDARAIVAGQAAERFYRALPHSAPSHVRTRLTVAQGASLEWLPQETILFDAASVDRRLDINLALDSHFLGVECLVLGRAAMGESVERLHLRDVIEVRLGGKLVLHDAIRLTGEARRTLARPATGGGSRAFATVLYAGPDGPRLLNLVREVLGASPAEAGASAWDGLLVIRIAAESGAALRATVTAVLRVLRGGAELPRVWLC